MFIYRCFQIIVLWAVRSEARQPFEEKRTVKKMKAIEKLIGKRVIIRADRAGVFYGTLAEVESNGDKLQVELTDLRRLWYWEGAASLSQMAVNGVTKPRNCKFTVTVPEIIVLDAIEILACSDKAEKSIREVGEWKM